MSWQMNVQTKRLKSKTREAGSGQISVLTESILVHRGVRTQLHRCINGGSVSSGVQLNIVNELEEREDELMRHR